MKSQLEKQVSYSKVMEQRLTKMEHKYKKVSGIIDN